MKQKLYIIETHPIQYKAPLFRALAADERFDVTVLYAMIPDAAQQGAGFGVSFSWDVPLLDGYPYKVLKNVARSPGVTHFGGCDTPEIYQMLREARPDAVLVNGWVVKTCLQALWSCRRLGIPCLVRGEANLLRHRAWWKHAIHRLLLKQYRGFLYIGEANRAFYRFHGCREERLFSAPYVVDNDYFAHAADARASHRLDLRMKMGVGPDACIFLFAGKLEEKKRPADLLRAAASLPSELKKKINLLFAGDGPLRASLEAEARASRVSVRFAGFMNQSQLPDAYAVSDVLVLPSDAGETWGLVVNEAMSSGRPALVSSLVGCAADLIVAGETGRVHACGNVAELAQNMVPYLNDPSLASLQGERARHHISNFTYAVVIKGIYEAICSLRR